MSGGDQRELALLIAGHYRLDPMTRNDRCICGYSAEIGKLFTEHIAAEAIGQGWKK